MRDNNLIPIVDTDFSIYFEDIEDCDIYLLSKDYSKSFWKKIFGDKTESYFNLSDDCWLINGKSSIVGEWMESYNADENKFVSDILANQMDWKEQEIIRFCMSSSLIFQTSWLNFKLHWDAFLAIDDDCPILLSENNDCSLLFRPIGDMVKICRNT